MAMIFELDVPREEVDAIAAFLKSGGESDVPTLGELGTKVIDRLTRTQKGLWHVAIGSFIEYTPSETRDDLGRISYFVTPEDGVVNYADALYDQQGQTTGRWGRVITDYEQPAAVFEIGVPL